MYKRQVHDRRVVPCKLAPDLGKRQVGHGPDQVHRNLPRFGGIFVLERASQDLLFDVIVLADLADNE